MGHDRRDDGTRVRNHSSTSAIVAGDGSCNKKTTGHLARRWKRSTILDGMGIIG